ncbi:hypothetical protein MycrhDRAFT_6961 [Mycolicibacterium rhodesiae JS60]|nr:hypothetical protein MycrhDRAFT_6961 [Mycolicibacterium rhodesiae JS60]
MSRGIGRAAKAIADVIKVAMSSTAALVRLIIIMVVAAAIFIGVLWLAKNQGWNLDPFRVPWPPALASTETPTVPPH